MRRTATVLAAAAVVIAVLAGAAIYNATQSTAPQTGAPLASPAPATPAPSGGGAAPLILTPSIPGWNPVRSVKRAVVYDVPPAWQVLSEGTITGFEDKAGKPRVAGSGSASFGDGACGGRNNTLAAATTKQAPGGIDLARVSSVHAQEWADAAYRDDNDRPPSVTLSPPEAITTPAGQPAVIVKATATLAAVTGDCKITRGAVYAISATGYRGELGPTVSLIIVVDEQITGAQPVPDNEIRQILPTLRPAP